MNSSHSSQHLPSHVAIIMDGNGRWAQMRGKNRVHGHTRGARVAKNIIIAAVEAGLKNLTLFTFSTENWKRPRVEVDFLMKLLSRQIVREQETLMTNNVRFTTIGDLSRLPQTVRKVVLETMDMTSRNTGMNLVFALSYGGRQEIAEATRRLAEKVADGQLTPQQIDESTFANHLESSYLPDADLIIRTSGEQRLSNFFLWQSAYAEIMFLDKLWPDFTAQDFNKALAEYARRERRFGCVSPETSDQPTPAGPR